MRAFLIVLDSVGIGAAPDAADYADAGSNTLGHLSAAAGGLRMPTLERFGLGNIPGLLPGGIAITGVPSCNDPVASFGAMREISAGKDTTTGHWEIAGLILSRGFTVFPHDPPSFPHELVAAVERKTGRHLIGNKAASGTAIIDELGPQQMQDGSLICYTSADSVFQIAAHEEVIPLRELYRACEVARELCDPLRVGRVIARPYVGQPGAFKRTDNRRDYSYPLPQPTVLEHLQAHGIPVTTVGKIDDIYLRKGISTILHVENNPDAEKALLDCAGSSEGLVFVNLIDFDMRYGHRRDPVGYARALEVTDGVLAQLIGKMRPDDILMITADHGNDPTFAGTDHTREYVPLLVYQPGVAGRSLGIRQGFHDVAQSLAAWFRVPSFGGGKSFLE